MTVGGTTTAPSLPATGTPAPADAGPVVDPNITPSSRNSGFFAAVGSMSSRIGSVGADLGGLAGLKTGEDGLELKPANLITLGALNVGVAGAIALAKRGDLPPGVTQGIGDTLTETAKQAGTNGIRITPTLVSAIAGPALADGLTYLAPNLLPKYKKEMKPAEKQKVQITRAIVGGVAIGVAAGVTFLLKPDLFKKFGVNFLSDEAIKGATHYVTSGGKEGMVLGVKSAEQIMAIGGERMAGESVKILKTLAPMARDAAFSNRMVLGTAGGIGALLLANKAAGAEGDERRNWGIAAAVTGAATIGGIAAMGKLTNSIGALQNTGFMFKPNIQWVKEYATKIAPITAVPAGTAASQYFDIVSDFEEITAARSPFRK